MSDNYLRIISDSPYGEVGLSKDVFDYLTINALREIKGVYFDSNYSSDQLPVRCYLEDKRLVIDVAIKVKYGYRIHMLTNKIQDHIIDVIEQATGISPSRVNIQVIDIEF